MGHQRGRKPLLEFVELGVFVAYLSPVKDPAPQQLKTLKSDYYHVFLPCQSPFSFTTAWRPLLCSLPWICPESFLCISVAQQLESKLTRTCTSLSLCHLRGSCTVNCPTLFRSCFRNRETGKPSRTAELAYSILQGRAPSGRTWRPYIQGLLHASSSKNAARSRSSAPSTGVQSHLSKLLTIRRNTAARLGSNDDTFRQNGSGTMKSTQTSLYWNLGSIHRWKESLQDRQWF